MEFFGMGFGELLLIFILILILFGPNKLPEIVRKMGGFVYSLRKASTELTTAVTREIESEKKNIEAELQPPPPAQPAPAPKSEPGRDS